MQLKIISTGRYKKQKKAACNTAVNNAYITNFFLKFATKETTKSELLLFIQYLKQHNHPIDVTNKSGMTLLHVATFNGNIDATKLLLENGASKTLKDNLYNYSALDWACTGLILPYGSIQTNTANNHHLEILSLFSEEPNYSIIKLYKTQILWKEKWALLFKSNETTNFKIIATQTDMNWKASMSQVYTPLSKLDIHTDLIEDKDTLVIKEILKKAKTNSSEQHFEQSLAMQDEYISYLEDLDD